MNFEISQSMHVEREGRKQVYHEKWLAVSTNTGIHKTLHLKWMKYEFKWRAAIVDAAWMWESHKYFIIGPCTAIFVYDLYSCIWMSAVRHLNFQFVGRDHIRRIRCYILQQLLLENWINYFAKQFLFIKLSNCNDLSVTKKYFSAFASKFFL